MASPLTFSQRPVSRSRCCMISGIVPSPRGPMSSRKFPFFETMSTRVCTTSSAVM
nr:hypothetical protein [Fodinicola feengrottensis]